LPDEVYRAAPGDKTLAPTLDWSRRGGAGPAGHGRAPVQGAALPGLRGAVAAPLAKAGLRGLA